MNVAKLLSLSFVMIAGPQILTAIFLATTEKWRSNSAALVAGASVSVTTVVTIGFLLGTGASDRGASSNGISYVILVLLVAAALLPALVCRAPTGMVLRAAPAVVLVTLTMRP